MTHPTTPRHRRRVLLAAASALVSLAVTAGPASAERGAMHQPTSGTVTGKIGWRCSSGSDNHDGIDIAAPQTTPVYAAYRGVVEFAGDRGDGYGKQIVIRHPHNYWTRYAHLYAMNADAGVGMSVSREQRIGAVGSTGNSSGYHLHFEVRRDSAWGPVHWDLNQGYTCGGTVTAKNPIGAPFPDLPA